MGAGEILQLSARVILQDTLARRTTIGRLLLVRRLLVWRVLSIRGLIVRHSACQFGEEVNRRIVSGSLEDKAFIRSRFSCRSWRQTPRFSPACELAYLNIRFWRGSADLLMVWLFHDTQPKGSSWQRSQWMIDLEPRQEWR